MKTARNSKINRLITLCFASVLLVLIYGPLAQWFVAADRLVYDQLAGNLPTRSLNNAFIVSIDPKKATPADTFGLYGKVLEKLREADAGRIILASPPDIPTDRKLPKWSALMASGAPIFVPSRHRFAEVSANNGFVDMRADADGVLRRSELWHLNGGVMSPSLPLAVALASTATATATAPGMTNSNGAIYFSNYAELPRLSVEEVFERGSDLAGATVFVDAEPTLATAAGVLPSGQFVTASELTAALLADIENDRMIVEPGWAKALSWVAPALLAIIAVLLLPDRNRREIAVLTLSALVALLLLEALVLLGLHVRIGLGRPMLLLAGIALLNAYLVPDVKKVSHDAFKKGADFLNAGRLEPAFAEFRRCNPSETVAALMYKLSLAFEEQAKPERAEAVLEWMKRTHVGPEDRNPSAKNVDGMPQKLGRYVIQRRIGRGAMGTVYLGKDPRINRAVAVKAIPIEKEFEDEELKEARLRFYREAESAGRLTHPNIITVFDAGEDKGLAYIAMEYLPGIALTDFTDPARLLAPKRAMELCATTAEALDYAHNQGVIHRDIKPANLLYNPKDGSLKISDFGVAHMTDNNRTKTGIVLGTPMYMSPEQLGAEDLTGLSDLFSLGVTLYELLVGEVPFRAPNIAVLMTKITSEDPAPVASRRSGIPPSVDAVLAKALAKRPEDRFSCGAEMAIALRNCARFS